MEEIVDFGDGHGIAIAHNVVANDVSSLEGVSVGCGYLILVFSGEEHKSCHSKEGEDYEKNIATIFEIVRHS